MKTTAFGRHRFQDDSTICANNESTTVENSNNEEGKKTLLGKAKDNWKPMAIGAGILAVGGGAVWATKKFIVPAIKSGINKAKAMCGSEDAPAEDKPADDFEPTK